MKLTFVLELVIPAFIAVACFFNTQSPKYGKVFTVLGWIFSIITVAIAVYYFGKFNK